VKSIYSPTQSVRWPPAEAPHSPSRPPSVPVPAPPVKPAEAELTHAEPAASLALTEAPAPESIAIAEKPTFESVSLTPKPAATQGPFVEVLPETVSGSRWERIVGSVPVLRHFKKQEIISAVPTYEENPLANVPDRRNITHSVFVDIKINVSEAGKVIFAEVSKYGEPPNLNLANAALSAAKQWVFKPARISNTPVSSEMVLHFHFVP
jgi:hypothetical protein